MSSALLLQGHLSHSAGQWQVPDHFCLQIEGKKSPLVAPTRGTKQSVASASTAQEKLRVIQIVLMVFFLS
jgi:hypothetical protein